MTTQTPHTLTYKAVTMNRSYKRLVMVVADLIALPLALWSAYSLRLSEWWPESYLVESWWLFVVIPVAGVYIFMRLGLYRAVVRFMGAQAIWAVTKGVLFLALLLWSLAYIFALDNLPRSVPINFALAALVYVGGSRLLVRHYYHWAVKYYVNKEAVLIYGAGGAGIQLASALSDGREFYPVGFIDDDQTLWGSTIKGLPISSVYDVEELVENLGIKHILLAVPQATNKERRQMLEHLDGVNVHVQTIPSMPELLEGKASIEQLREVHIEELLGRDPVPALPSLMSKCITDKVVMVTGAGGSIGSELCRQVLQQRPNVLLLFEYSEYALYQIHQELKIALTKFPDGESITIYPLLGSVTDYARVNQVIQHFEVHTIYHAAAYKHVPLVEHNVAEGVVNNIFGTQTVAEVAALAGVRHFILISTDKAVRPTNVMGATKRFAELILQNLAVEYADTVFSMVRFGNVLGSSGSVVPLFRKQIKTGGPVTVTHKDITRFFMTIPEAACLVIQAGSMAKGGDVFVLDMGESVKIIELAKRMIRLSGLEVKDENNPDGDIEIQCTGLRPAEKLYEELLVGDNVSGTDHSKIMRANEMKLSAEDVKYYLTELRKACNDNERHRLRTLLQQAVTGYRPHDCLVDFLCESSETLRNDQVKQTTNVVKLHQSVE